MHILVIPSWYHIPHQPMRGSFFREQAEALCEAGHKVGVIYPEFRSLASLHQGHIRLGSERASEGPLQVWRWYGLKVPKMRQLDRRRWVARASWLYDRYVKDQGTPDIIHAHGAVWAGVAAEKIAAATGLPYVLTEHSTGYARGVFTGRYKPPIRRAIENAAEVIAVSGPLKARIAPYRNADDIHVIPNMIDTTRFCPPAKPRDQTNFRFICVAFLQKKKAIDLLLGAFADAFAGRADVFLDIVGDGPERTALEALARALGVSAQVAFLGLRDREGVRDALWSAHCCVSSSYVETFGVNVIEALATGIPVIATRSGGPETIVDARSGIVLEVGDRRALAAAMRQVISDRDLWRDRTEDLHRLVDKRYSPSTVIDRVTELYSRHLGRKHQGTLRTAATQ